MGATRYGPFARLADWYHGWRDGRAGVPDRERGVATTAHREMLIRRAQDAFELERLVLEERSDAAMRALAAATESRRQTALRLAEAHGRLAAMPTAPEPAVLTARRPGEERRDEAIVRLRRAREHDWRRRRGESTVSRARRELEAVARKRAALRDAVDREILAARGRVRRIHEHTHRRLAVYRRKLVRVHPQGAWVNVVMDSVAPELPGWAVRGVDGEPLPSDGRPPVWTQPPPSPPRRPDPQPCGRLIPIGPVTTFGADRDRVDVLVESGYGVAGLHATLGLRGDGYRLFDRNRGEGTFHDGEPVRWADIAVGGTFIIGDNEYRVVRIGLLAEVRLGPSDLVISRLSATARDTRTRQPRRRLTRMSFTQRACTVLAVLGPSGAGKSSLFHAVLGELELGEGSLFFSKLDIRRHSDQLRPRLGFVPQDEHVYRTLTVRQVLGFADCLRRPRDRVAGRDERVAGVCAELGIADKLDELVGNLSGGQRKRVSIALELLAEPRLLMLDEPTSGLDPARDRELMQILARRAARGCTVMVITHSTQHLEIADQVLVVASEGRPVYLGPPAAALPDLSANDYAELMERLTADPSVDAAKYQSGRAAAAAAGAAAALHREAESAGPARPSRGRGLGPSFGRQLHVLVRRQIALVLTRVPVRHAPTRAKAVHGAVVVAMPLVVAAVGAYLAAIVVGDDGLAGATSARTALSLLVTLGMLGAQALTYSDIVSDYPMIHREHRTGTRTTAVVLSKWLVFAVVAVLQAAVITTAFCSTAPGPPRSLVLGRRVELFVDMAALGVAAMSLGLLISVLARKLEQAVAIATAAAIAQVALNGATADLADRHLVLQAMSWPLPARWGFAAAASSVDLTAVAPMATADSLWRHTTGWWVFDLAALAVLTVTFTALTIVLLDRRLNGPQT